MKTTAGVNNL